MTIMLYTLTRENIRFPDGSTIVRPPVPSHACQFYARQFICAIVNGNLAAFNTLFIYKDIALLAHEITGWDPMQTALNNEQWEMAEKLTAQ